MVGNVRVVQRGTTKRKGRESVQSCNRAYNRESGLSRARKTVERDLRRVYQNFIRSKDFLCEANTMII